MARPRPRQPSTAKGTKRLSAGKFAYPKSRKYPIDTAKRFRAALSYAGRKNTAGTRATIISKGLRSKNKSVRAAAQRARKSGVTRSKRRR